MDKYVYMYVIIKGFIRFDDRRLISPTVVICWIEADGTVTALFRTPEAPEKKRCEGLGSLESRQCGWRSWSVLSTNDGSSVDSGGMQLVLPAALPFHIYACQAPSLSGSAAHVQSLSVPLSYHSTCWSCLDTPSQTYPQLPDVSHSTWWRQSILTIL